MGKWIQKNIIGVSTYGPSCISGDGLVMYLTDWTNNKVYKSINNGNSWADITPVGVSNAPIVKCNGNGQVVVVSEADNGRIYVSINGGIDWIKRDPIDDNNYNWRGLFCNNNGSIIYALVYISNFDSKNAKVYKTIDYGENWTELSFTTGSPLNGVKYVDGSDDGSVIYISSSLANIVYVSVNSGVDWVETVPNAGDTNNFNVCCNYDGSIAYTINNYNVYKTIDYGVNWTRVKYYANGTGATTLSNAIDCSSNGLIVFQININSSGITDGRVYKSINGGSNWTEEQPAGDIDAEYWRSIAINNNGEYKLLNGASSAGWVYVYSNPILKKHNIFLNNLI